MKKTEDLIERIMKGRNNKAAELIERFIQSRQPLRRRPRACICDRRCCGYRVRFIRI